MYSILTFMRNVYIALENIRSLYNVGAIFRTCSFFGFYNVLLVGYSGKDYKGITKVLHEKVKKSSLGSEKDLNIKFIPDSNSLINFAQKNELEIISIEQNEKSISLGTFCNRNYPLENKIFVLGNEVTGVSKKIQHKSQATIEISRHGKHTSLNVTTTCGIVLHSLTSIVLKIPLKPASENIFRPETF